jgi:hypothetical protein
VILRGLRGATVAGVLLVSAIAAHPRHESPRHDAPRHVAAWIPFRWYGDAVGGRFEPHAALYVPVELDGIAGTYYLQLDTGAGWPRWYEVPLRQVMPQSFGKTGRDTAPDEIVLSGRVGTVSFARDTFLVEKGFGDSLSRAGPPDAPRVIGTLGLRFFRDRILVLDFPHQRLAIVGRDDSMPASSGKLTYVPARYQHGYLFVPLRVANRPVEDFFYDTGASAFALVTTASTWRQFTGRTGSEPGNLRMTVSSWGKQVEDVGAPVAGAVEIGPVRAVRPLVFHQREVAGAPDFFARNPGLSGGIIGNALFADSSVVVIDLARRRFGIGVACPP